MQQRTSNRKNSQMWIEWILWKAAAWATLAMLVGLLLVAFSWLDRIDPASQRGHAEYSTPQPETATSSGARAAGGEAAHAAR